MTSLKLTKLKFCFGPPKSRDPLEVGLKNITILVGLNNSGKSQTLKEIEMWNRNKYSISMSESNAFYDAEMIAQLINAMLQHRKKSTINRITAAEVSYVMNQLKAVGVTIP